jgi:hypothetical protein
MDWATAMFCFFYPKVTHANQQDVAREKFYKRFCRDTDAPHIVVRLSLWIPTSCIWLTIIIESRGHLIRDFPLPQVIEHNFRYMIKLNIKSFAFRSHEHESRITNHVARLRIWASELLIDLWDIMKDKCAFCKLFSDLPRSPQYRPPNLAGMAKSQN